MENIVELKNLKKNYGTKKAVKGIDLQIRKGELFTLLGANGAGKTTTLKMLVGLLKPTSGNIIINGMDTLKMPTQAKDCVSYVPDVPYIYDKLTPWELLRFIGKLYYLKPSQIKNRGEELLKFFKIWEARDTLVEEFSHGMRQKAILAAALLHEPKIFILDEPMVGLDPISIHQFKSYLKDEVKKGMTVIFSTHTLSTAEELADRVGIINQGELIALGTIEELKEKYQSKENLENMFMKLVEDGMVKN